MPFSRVPSSICFNSSTSLVSLVSLDSEDDHPSTPQKMSRGSGVPHPKSQRISRRGFAVTERSNCMSTSQAPSLPRRQYSREMGFLGTPSSSTTHHKDAKANERFDLGESGTKPKLSLFETFGITVSPSESEFSRKTRMSISSVDTPLSIPRRKPSQQSFSRSFASRIGLKNAPSMSKTNEVSLGLKNDKFADLRENSNRSAGMKTPKCSVPRYFSSSPLRI